MNYLILTLLIVGISAVAYKGIDYLKATRGTEGYAKRKIFSYLFLAFMALIGITTVFADALFEFLGLHKPAQFEWLALAAFAILAYAGIRIAEGSHKNTSPPVGGTTITQHHSGSGDNVAGNKSIISGSKNVNTGSIQAGGNVHIGDKSK